VSAEPPRIAVFAGDAITRAALVAKLEEAGYVAEAHADAGAALARVEAGGVDVVIADSPRLCRALKSLGDERFVPVMLLVMATDGAGRLEGVLAGADVCLDEPIEETALLSQIDGMLRLKRAHAAWRSARAELEHVSLVDPMTGVYGFRYLHTRLPDLFDAAEQRHEPLACVLVDVDGLRQHNAEHGRAFGDSVLVQVARGVRAGVRHADVVVRYGADDFLLLLPGTHFGGAMTVAERVFEAVGAQTFSTPHGRHVSVAISMGVALFPGREVRTRGELLRAAAEALGDAKQEGGRRVAVFRHAGPMLTRSGAP
jgi:two-component system, cell cycle response regulator